VKLGGGGPGGRDIAEPQWRPGDWPELGVYFGRIVPDRFGTELSWRGLVRIARMLAEKDTTSRGSGHG
jgi:hypothetical protein